MRTATLGAHVALRGGELSIVASPGTSLVGLAASDVVGLYDIGLFIPGPPPASAMVFQFVVPRAIALSANLAGSLAKAGTVATSAAAFTLRKNGSNIGTESAAQRRTAGFIPCCQAGEALASKRLIVLRGITRRVVVACDDQELRRSRDGTHLERPAEPQAAARHPGGGAPQAAFLEPGEVAR